MTLQFEVSRDTKSLHTYYKIRELCFRQDLGLQGFDGSEDRFDQEGMILLAREEGRCVGGVRLSPGGHHPQATPLEHEGVALAGLFPQLGAGEGRYCQLSRLALLPGHRTLPAVQALIRASVELAAELGFDYAFSVAGMSRARLYKRVLSLVGYDYRIFDQVAIPAEKGFSKLPHLLSVAKTSAGAPELRLARAPQLDRILPRVA